jgi:uncharacterized protein YlbG (UPF0298 family)
MKVETISFRTLYAEKYGIECAILIQGIQLGLSLNRNKESHRKFGKVWMYNSIREWSETYPFMSESTVKRTLNKLKELKIIEVMQLDSNPMNKTNWYTLTNALGQFEPIEEFSLNQSKQYKTNSIKQTIDNRGDKPQPTKFIIPTIEELQKEFPNLDSQRFHDFYTAKGWMIGKNKMKDWKATARNWMRNDKKETNQQGYKKLTLND